MVRPRNPFFVGRAVFAQSSTQFCRTLERVGAGAWDPIDVKTALDACERAACGPVSPPQGLYLAGVRYPKDPFA